jgi:hypothetical protein
MEGSAPSETKKEPTNNRLRAIIVGALTTLGIFALTNRKSRMIMVLVQLDRLTPYHEAARDERPEGGRTGSSWRVNTLQT